MVNGLDGLDGLDNEHFEEGNHCYCQQKRHHQVNGNGNREILQGIMESTLHRQ